jgi:DNA-binding XRE family transcriptional regulator
MRVARSAAAVRVLVAVRFPGLPHLSELEFDAAWPAEEARHWLTLARLVLEADGPVGQPGPASDSAPAVPPSPGRPGPGPAPEPVPPGRELRRWRQGAGLSQAQVAAAAGLSRSVVSAVEGGRRDGQPRSASRSRLARTLARLTVGPRGGAGAPADQRPRQ